MRRKIPDTVPVSPDISNMIPCRLTGKPYWDIYLYGNPPLSEAYMAAVRKFDFEAWMIHHPFIGGNTEFSFKENTTMSMANICVPNEIITSKILEKAEDKIIEEKIIKTPYGELETTTVFPREAPPWNKSKIIKDIKTDFKKLRWVMGEKWAFQEKCIGNDKLGDDGIYAVAVELPVDWWHALRHGGTQRALMDYFDYKTELEEIFEFYTNFAEARVKAALKAKPDEILFSGSASSLSVISPKIYKKYNLPFLKRLVKLCNDAGIIAHQHTCGRSWGVMEINHAELGLDVMEPLEKPPTGDVDLAKAKKMFGDKFALKGNISTIGPLLNGTPKDVEKEVIETLDAAKAGGGFILSTGDQVGGNTPLENLEALVTAGRKYGKY